MTLALNKIVLSGANANSAGAYFQVALLNVNASTTLLIPAGTYLLPPTANVNVQIQTASTGNTWSLLLANNTGGMLISDGVNVRLNNAEANAKSITSLTINPSTNATGQYNT